jgi:hypothetical protein
MQGLKLNNQGVDNQPQCLCVIVADLFEGSSVLLDPIVVSLDNAGTVHRRGLRRHVPFLLEQPGLLERQIAREAN